MKLDITEKQTKILSQLLIEKARTEDRINLVIQTLAAGTDLETWESVELNVEDNVLTFKLLSEAPSTEP